jgi:hypothetical protein
MRADDAAFAPHLRSLRRARGLSPHLRSLRRAEVLAAAALSLLLGWSASASAEVLIRWDQNDIPSPASLGISTLVVPAANSAAVGHALALGYRLFVEVEAPALARFVPPAGAIAGVIVKGEASPEQLVLLRQRLKPGARVVALEDRGKWPHIRSNWVTRINDVLQVSSRSAQPWIENNAALLRIVRATRSGSMPLITYPWLPITLSEIDEGPEVENYLVAIAEAGSFGGDLLLPLHERFQKSLLLGQPQARAAWERIRRHMEFYSWDLPGRYQPIANIGVVTSDPLAWFEVMNLLCRHNLPFELIAPARLSTQAVAALDLLIVLDRPDAAQMETLAAFARKGGAVVIDAKGTVAASARPWGSLTPVLKSDDRVSYRLGDGRVVEVLKGIPDPNRFALEMRQILGREHRVIDIWNGITVITAPYQEPGGGSVLVTVINYAHQPLPVQVRVPGAFSLVTYESPDERPALLPYQYRDGCTEFVVPALSVGGRVFLSRSP